MFKLFTAHSLVVAKQRMRKPTQINRPSVEEQRLKLSRLEIQKKEPTMSIREIVLQELATLVEEFSPMPFPDDVTDETQLDEFWLDSVAFMTLITNLEERLGMIPPAIMQGEFIPKTVGEFVAMYAEAVPEGI